MPGVIAAGEHPHFTTINQFRLDHGESLGELFAEVLLMCQRAGLVKMGRVALDGTKIKAAASKHKAMSYKRMNKDEARLQAEVQEEEGLPPELSRRETRLQRLRAAKAELEKEAAEARAAELREQAERQRARVDDESLPDHERKRSRTLAEKAERQAEALAPKKKNDRDEGEADQKELPLHRVASRSSRRSATSPTPRAASWSRTGRTSKPTTYRSSWMMPIK